KIPVIANIRPSGTTYLMEDFFYAGGLRAGVKRLESHLHKDPNTGAGRPVVESAENANIHNVDVIRPLDRPIYAEGATAVLRGNLAPDGCVMKPSAAEARFLKHKGPAIVFESYA